METARCGVFFLCGTALEARTAARDELRGGRSVVYRGEPRKQSGRILDFENEFLKLGLAGINVTSKHLRRIVLTSFVVTFLCARTLVLLIMERKIPDLYLHLGGNHVHHLNYGIFLLSIVGAVLLFAPPAPGRRLDIVAILYGVGLALTFDEFGMWLHLGGSYWQRASFDAITVLCGVLALAAYTPRLKYWNRRRFAWAVVFLSLLCIFFWRLSLSLSSIESRLEHIEIQGPS